MTVHKVGSKAIMRDPQFGFIVTDSSGWRSTDNPDEDGPPDNTETGQQSAGCSPVRQSEQAVSSCVSILNSTRIHGPKNHKKYFR